ncbi:dihydroorotate dehydrogenase-like protein [Sulfuriflexus mobilis]|uniref:dihydroorotate dehydrogenase-like protein n=1 Tax=Sulfuriflexus mobilis TaxID=1811807 RepID=UPI000F820580
MIDLTTDYLGLKLDNPLVPASSPLTGNFDDARRLQDAGASALVLPSLFEEVVHHQQKQLEQYVYSQALGHYEADSYRPVPDEYAGDLENYLEHIQRLKTTLDIPVIASLNGISTSGWIDFGKDMQQAGADALELNVYYVAADPHQSGEEVENRYLQLLTDLRGQVSIPVTMKLSSQFSSVANIVSKLQQTGAAGVVLFNRFYQPDIDLDTLTIKPRISLSNPMESLLRIRWIALLRGRVDLSLAATGGFHDIDAILKALLAGADVVYLCSVLLEKGPAYYAELLQQLRLWLEEREYESVTQMQGSVSQACAIDPAAFEHSNYFDVIKSYKK